MNSPPSIKPQHSSCKPACRQCWRLFVSQSVAQSSTREGLSLTEHLLEHRDTAHRHPHPVFPVESLSLKAAAIKDNANKRLVRRSQSNPSYPSKEKLSSLALKMSLTYLRYSGDPSKIRTRAVQVLFCGTLSGNLSQLKLQMNPPIFKSNQADLILVLIRFLIHEGVKTC